MSQFQPHTEQEYDDSYFEEEQGYPEKRKRLATPQYDPYSPPRRGGDAIAWLVIGSVGMMLAGGSLAYVLTAANPTPAVFLFPMVYMLGALRIMRHR